MTGPSYRSLCRHMGSPRHAPAVSVWLRMRLEPLPPGICWRPHNLKNGPDAKAIPALQDIEYAQRFLHAVATKEKA